MSRAQKINRYELWRAAAMRNGEPRVLYPCPHCETQLIALKPAAGVTWDSHTECPYCETLFYKVIGTSQTGEAHVTTQKIGA